MAQEQVTRSFSRTHVLSVAVSGHRAVHCHFAPSERRSVTSCLTAPVATKSRAHYPAALFACDRNFAHRFLAALPILVTFTRKPGGECGQQKDAYHEVGQKSSDDHDCKKGAESPIRFRGRARQEVDQRSRPAWSPLWAEAEGQLPPSQTVQWCIPWPLGWLMYSTMMTPVRTDTPMFQSLALSCT
jgi:hypothetical protein